MSWQLKRYRWRVGCAALNWQYIRLRNVDEPRGLYLYVYANSINYIGLVLLSGHVAGFVEVV